jgi:hypothetical protein
MSDETDIEKPITGLIPLALQVVDQSVEPDTPYAAPGRAQLHYSGLDRLFGCGEAFYRIYILGEKMDASVSMMVGTAVDKSVARNLGNKILTGQLLATAEVESIARDSFEIEWRLRDRVLSAEEKLAGEAKVKGDGIDKSIRLARLHHRELAPIINPTHVQRKWAISIPGFQFDLVGEIDIQEGAEAIRDTKAKGKSPNESEVHYSDQLTQYHLAVKVLDKVDVKSVKLDCVIDNKTPVAKVYSSTRDADDHRVLLNRVERAAEVIESGAFTPAQPTDWRCSPKWCGFFSTCKFAKRPKFVVIDKGE